VFTGIVESVGVVERVEPLGEGRRVTIAVHWSGDLSIGDSVAVDGCCLTVVERNPAAFTVEAVRETLARTIAGRYEPASRVNLERSLIAGDRLDGHLVQGHVDTVATLAGLERRDENRYIDVSLPGERSLVAERGSIAVNGVSLTVLDLTDDGFRVSIVPHTWAATTFADLAGGDPVNVEFDVVARYLARIVEARS